MYNYVPVGLIILSTFVASFVGIWLNKKEGATLRDEMNRRFDESAREANRRFDESAREANRRFNQIEVRLSLIESDQKQFFAVTG